MKLYAAAGHKEFILCLGYKGEVIKEYFRNYLWNTSDVTLKLGRQPKIQYHSTHDEEDWTVTLLETGLETQTGGRLRRALAHIHDDTFLHLRRRRHGCESEWRRRVPPPVPRSHRHGHCRETHRTLRRTGDGRQDHHRLPGKARTRIRLHQRGLHGP